MIIINDCMFCGKVFDAKDVYDFYCSGKCEVKDTERIRLMGDAGVHPIKIMMDSPVFAQKKL